MIARRSLVIILNKGVGTITGFLGIFFVFRYLDKGSFGMFAFTFALLELFATINGVGFNASHVKRVSEGHDEARANATFLAVKFGQLGIFLAVLFGSYFVWAVVLGQGFEDTTPRLLVLMTAVYVVLAMRQYFDYSFRSHRRVAIGESVLFIDSIVTAIGYFTISQVWRHNSGQWVPFQDWAAFWADALNLHGPLTVEEGAILMTAAFFLGTLTSFILSAAFFVGHRYPFGRPDLVTFRRYWDFAWPVALVSVMTTLYANMDAVLVGYFWEPVHVADYRSSVKLLIPAMVFGQAVYTIMFPTISKMHAKERLGDVVDRVRLAERYLAMALLGVLSLAVVFAEEAFHIAASDAYITAAPTLRLLTVYVLFMTLIMPSKSILMGTGSPLLMARVGAVTTFLVVALDLILVPPSILGVPLFGLAAPGAALGTAIALAVAYAHVKTLAKTKANLPWIPAGIFRQLAAAGLTIGILWFAKVTLGPSFFDRVWELALAGIAGLVLYAALLVLVREFRRRDWEFLRDLLDPGEMSRYMSDELRGKKNTDREE